MGLYEERVEKARGIRMLTSASFGVNDCKLNDDALLGVLYRMSNDGLLNADGEAVYALICQMIEKVIA